MGNLCTARKFEQFNSWVSTHFPHIPLDHSLNTIINPLWLVGFTEGDGSFFVTLRDNLSYRCGTQVQAVFDIAQHISEAALLRLIGAQYFGSHFNFASSGTVEH
jgi:hypothetical protein